MRIGMKAMQNREEVGAASVDYLMYSGYITMAYLWARMAVTAQEKLDAGAGDQRFYQAKLKTARFYFERILPRTKTLEATIDSGADNLLSMDIAEFSN